MISKFKNQFKKHDLDEKQAFQNRVVSFLKKQYPAASFKKSDDSLVIFCNENKLGLTNLYAKFLLTAQTNYELKELATKHFEIVFSADILIESTEKSWTDTKSFILPQLMPIEYTKQFPTISFPLSHEVVIGFVVDDEKAYRYVTKDDLENWKISDLDLRQKAIDNLTDKSFDLEMTFVPPPNGIVVVDTMDSFDAVRILVPHLQEFFAEKLGKPFHFGIPNRDFLICWSKRGDADFQTSIKQQIATDFEERPYPLSKYVYELDEKGEIKQLRMLDNESENKQNWIRNN